MVMFSSFGADLTIISNGTGGAAIADDGMSGAQLTCSDIYGNVGGDWTGSIGGQLGWMGNLSEDPLYCNRPTRDYRLTPGSPCDATCGKMGLYSVGCGK